MSDYITKIEALLAKAESSTHEAEAETYREKAQELMLKWGIEDAQLAEKKRSQKKAGEKIIRIDVELRGEYHRGLFYVYDGIARGLGSIRTFMIAGRGNQTWFVAVGHETDLERLKLLGRSFTVQALSAMRQWWKTSEERERFGHDRPMSFVAKRQFIISFGTGVGASLIAQRDAVVVETGTELVFVGRDKRVGDWVEENLQTRENKSSIRGHYGAQQHGFRAGERAGTEANTKVEVGA